MKTITRALVGVLAAACLSACADGAPALAAAANPVTRSLPAVATAPIRASTLDEKGWLVASSAWGSALYADNAAKPHLTPAQQALGRKVTAEGRAVRRAGDAALEAANAENLGAQIGALGRVVSRLNELRQ